MNWALKFHPQITFVILDILNGSDHASVAHKNKKITFYDLDIITNI